MAETTTVKTEKSEGGALDVPTTNMADLVRPVEGGYMEDQDHRPEPTAQYGTMDTSDTAGGAQNSIEEIAPIFRAARAQNMIAAARALDPDDEDVPAEMVTLPQATVTVTGSARTADEGRRDVANALRKLADSPIQLGGPSPEAERAGQENPNATADEGQTMSAEVTGSGAPSEGERVHRRGDVVAPDAQGASRGTSHAEEAAKTRPPRRT